jgi:hypothetical protein
MDCAMQSVSGLIGSHDPPIIPEPSCSASLVRNCHGSGYRHKRRQIENNAQECLGDRMIRQRRRFLFFTATPFLKLATKFKSFFSAKPFY